ncbi:arylamine N-acetyltransferase family protein [Streptomyces microflavus]|jgi:N-hydroxyarylamine O-acetyltransferase|uniref:N-acetyltransferase n=1 Tax=Streptomyces microflavus DSM 40593 TaxID=1303692 RepID=N0CRH9_STRMI|nr:arylamine N-acetyltransferase [Streptomyces microflavus]AGK78260.1 N-acetyltransferase [Streptomyces microflavus DSM 40593]
MYATGLPVDVDHSPEWGADRLDLDAYLRRIGYEGALDGSLKTLQQLHRAHMSTICFENIDIAVGRPVSLDMADLERKLVRSGRGGYCYETNLLFAAVLDRLGFPVVRILSRIREGDTRRRFRSHTSLLVRAVDEPETVWLADPGYGYAGLIEPIPLREGALSTMAGWSWQLGVDDDHWVLRNQNPEGGWTDLYAFRPERQYEVDYRAAHYISSTRPGSPFVNRLVVQRGSETVRHRLRNDVLVTDHPDGRTERAVLGPHEVVAALREKFGLTLTDEDVSLLLGFLHRGDTGSLS